jgi:hypothetical protein
VILPRDLWYSNIKDKVFSGCSNELTIRRSFKASHGLTDYTCVETADFKAQIGDGTGPASRRLLRETFTFRSVWR